MNVRHAKQTEAQKASEVRVSYASAIGRKSMNDVREIGGKSPRVNEGMNAREYAVVVRAKEEGSGMTNDQVKEKVLRDISCSLNVRVRAVRRARDGGIAIETVSEAERNKILECQRFDETGLRVELPKKIGPKVLARDIYDVPNEMTNERLLNELYAKNLSEYVTKNEFDERVRVVSRSNRKDAAVGNMIMEVTMCMRNAVCKAGRGLMGWNAFRVKEFTSVLRLQVLCIWAYDERMCGEGTPVPEVW